ncbi:uncharacterized protein LOC123315512 [Coccinella septempunctata]|uniref:uncharacterized protein LOC123315512 n=1 Tax=Coccinella septempunctata TaxID=41139 RepID=UPI001D08B698|nr:uncharacterized protein LOC123315512 [Coccinella septempunctata]
MKYKLLYFFQEIETVQSDSERTETPVSEGIIPSIITKTSDVAGDIANTAGQLAKDDIELKAALLTGILGGAGHAAGSALHETGQVAAHAVSNIEDGFKNIFGNFGK